MATTQNNLVMYGRNDKTINLTFTDSAGTPINLTGATIIMTAKKDPNDPDSSAIFQIRVTSHTAPLLGESAITITHIDTNTAIGIFYYDIKLIDSGGNNMTVTSGNFTIKRDITNSIA